MIFNHMDGTQQCVKPSSHLWEMKWVEEGPECPWFTETPECSPSSREGHLVYPQGSKEKEEHTVDEEAERAAREVEKSTGSQRHKCALPKGMYACA